MATRRTRKPSVKSGSRSTKPTARGVEADTEDDINERVPEGLKGAFVDSRLRSMRKRIEDVGLKLDEQYEGELPDLPDDIDTVDHSELSNIMLAYQGALSTATAQASMALIESNTMEEIADYLQDKALLDSDQSNSEKRKAEAATDEDVLYFRARRLSAHNSYIAFRESASSLSGKIKAISRVGGFKDDDNDGSDRTAKPKGRRRK